MRGTSQMDHSPIKTAWVAGVLPMEVCRSPERHVGSVAGVKAARREAGRQALVLADRIQAFFAANPEEELTASDAAIKFDCNRVTACNVMVKLERLGALGKRTDGKRCIYGAAA